MYILYWINSLFKCISKLADMRVHVHACLPKSLNVSCEVFLCQFDWVAGYWPASLVFPGPKFQQIIRRRQENPLTGNKLIPVTENFLVCIFAILVQLYLSHYCKTRTTRLLVGNVINTDKLHIAIIRYVFMLHCIFFKLE